MTKIIAKFLLSMGLLGLLCLVQPGSLWADTVTVFMNSSGAVQSADLSATFDPLTSDNFSSSPYVEGGLVFSTPGAQYAGGFFTPAPAGFSGGFLYSNGGSPNPLTITTADNAILYGIEFYIGSGYSERVPGEVLPIAYQLSLGGNVVGSGSFDAVQTINGYLLGFSDNSGFDTLTITNCAIGVEPCALSDYNALAIDNVTADITPRTAVPEPTSLSLLGMGLLALTGMGWRHSQTAIRRILSQSQRTHRSKRHRPLSHLALS